MVSSFSEESIFDFARRIKSEELRNEYLGQVCGTNEELRNRVEKLLKAHHQDSAFWDLGLSATGPTVDLLNDDSVERQVGRYKIREQIGEGGMGVVFVAEQSEPIKRRVALKLIKPGMDSRDVLARFEAERQALALMDHPNIASVFDAGTSDDGRPYFVMELVRGLPITEYSDLHRLNSRRRLKLFVDVCNAVQHAHQKGIIHRDLKPSNVLITELDGRALPKVIDFGVAKAINQQQLTDRTIYTRFQQFVGTPMYMSPEQAALSSVDVDTRSDIYSLGVLLYELLTGTTPYDRDQLKSASFDEVRRIIREQEPSKPSTKVRTLGETAEKISGFRGTNITQLFNVLRGDLDWIVMKALDKDRNRRYDTARGFANDIQRHLNDEIVVARPPSTAYRIQKTARRHKALFAAGTAVLATLIIGLIATTTQAYRAANAEQQAKAARREEQKQREQAESARGDAERLRANEQSLREHAEAQRLYARRRAYASDMNLAMLALKENNFGRARQLLNRQRPATGDDDLRCWEWRLLWQQCQGDVVFDLPKHNNSVNALAFNSDSTLLASGDWDGQIRIHDIGTGQKKHTLAAHGPIRGIKFINDGKNLISAGRQIKIWNLELATVVDTIDLTGKCRDFVVAPDDSSCAAIFQNQVSIWDMKSKSLIAEFETDRIYGDHPGRLAYSHDSKRLAIGDPGGDVRMIDIESEKEVMRFRAHKIGITALAFSPDDSRIATAAGYSSQLIRIWEAETGEQIEEKVGHTEWVSDVTFSLDGDQLISTSADQTVRIWDLAGNKPTKILRGHELEVWVLARDDQNQRIVSGCKDGTINFWDPAKPTCDVPYTSSSVPLGDMQFIAGGESLVVLKDDNTVAIWDAETLTEVELLSELGSDNRALDMSPDGHWCLVHSRQGDVKVFDLRRQAVATRLPALAGGSITTFLADGKTLAQSDLMRVRYWSTDEWRMVDEKQISDVRRTIHVSPSGNLGGYSRNGEVFLVDIHKNRLMGSRVAHKRGGHFAFSHDSKLMASVSNDGSMGMWSTDESLKPIGDLTGHMKGVHSVMFTPDNTRLVTGSGDHEIIRLWDVATCEQVATLSGEGYLVYTLRCSPDGNALAAINSDGKLHVWHPPSWDEILFSESRNRQVNTEVE